MLRLPPSPASRRRWIAAAACLALGACGGGFYLGDGIEDDDPPVVSMVASPDPVAPGATLRLQAAATDDFGIDNVAFFSTDGGISTQIGDDDESAPYVLDVIVDANADGTLQFFARATDDEGQSRDSALVSVAVDR